MILRMASMGKIISIFRKRAKERLPQVVRVIQQILHSASSVEVIDEKGFKEN